MSRTRYRIFETDCPYFPTRSVERYVAEAAYWRYSSSQNYAGLTELIDVVTDWR
jgi:hypothetical protein